MQMKDIYDPTKTADHNFDGSSKTSRWGLANFSSHYNASNKYFVFMFGVNDARTDSVGIPQSEYVSNMLEIYNRTLANDSIPILCIRTLANGIAAPGWGSHSVQVSQINAMQEACERYDIPYVKMYDAIDTHPWNGRIDDYNPYYYNNDTAHPNVTGHKAMAEFLWYFINGNDYTETYYASNDTTVINADYNETIYVARQNDWVWNDIKVYCTTNNTYLSWTRGYNNTIHFHAQKGNTYLIHGIVNNPSQPSYYSTIPEQIYNIWMGAVPLLITAAILGVIIPFVNRKIRGMLR